MKDELNYIDKIFDDGLGTTQIGGSSQGWEIIANRLNQKTSLAFWQKGFSRWIAGGAALTLLIAFLLWMNKTNLDGKLESPEQTFSQPQINGPIANESISNEDFDLKVNSNPNNLFQPLETELDLISEKKETIKTESNDNWSLNKIVLNDIPGKTAQGNFQTSADHEPFIQSEHLHFTDLYENNSEEKLAFNFRKLPFRLASLPIPLFPFSDSFKKRNNNIQQPVFWNVSAYYAFHPSSGLFPGTDNSEQLPLLGFIANSESKVYLQEWGFRVEMRKRNYLFETGLSSLKFEDKRSFERIETTINQQTIWSYFDTSFLQIDTIDSYYQIVGGDTTVIYVTESEWISFSDSSHIVQIDTLIDTQQWQTRGVYRYWEIPIIAGYSFTHNLLTTSIKFGGVNSFLWFYEGNSPAGLEPNNITILTRDAFPKYRFDIYLGAELRYHLHSRYFVFGEAFIRRSVNDLLIVQDIKYSFRTAGIKFGLGYYF